MMPLTWKSGRTSRLWSCRCPGPNASITSAHRGEVGVVEHHALRACRSCRWCRSAARAPSGVETSGGASAALAAVASTTSMIGRASSCARRRRRSRPSRRRRRPGTASPARVSAGLTGVAAAPRRQAANSAMISSTRFGIAIATTSPGPTPRLGQPRPRRRRRGRRTPRCRAPALVREARPPRIPACPIGPAARLW